VSNGALSTPDVAALLMRISGQLSVLIEQSSPSRSGSSLGKEDRIVLALLLPLIVTRYSGEAVFSSADAIEHAAGFPDVLEALKKVIGPDLSARRMGKLLSRAQNIDIGGLRVLRMTADKEGCLWVVRRI
jgi:hypothetical protein